MVQVAVVLGFIALVAIPTIGSLGRATSDYLDETGADVADPSKLADRWGSGDATDGGSGYGDSGGSGSSDETSGGNSGSGDDSGGAPSGSKKKKGKGKGKRK